MILTETLRKNRDKYTLVMFDVDGVLIDTSKSFFEAIILAVDRILSGRGIQISDTDLRNPLARIKTAPGFNNDWDAAEALLVFLAHRELCVLAMDIDGFIASLAGYCEGSVSWERWTHQNAPTASKPLLRLLESSPIRETAMEYYAGSEMCADLYGIEPAGIAERGTHLNEAVLADTALLDSLACARGIYTGRNRPELDMALEKLLPVSWDTNLLFCDTGSGPESVKPSPLALLRAAEYAQSSALIFAGDSPDDYAAAVNARQERPGLDVEFAAVGPALWAAAYPVSRVSNINELLTFLYDRGVQ